MSYSLTHTNQTPLLQKSVIQGNKLLWMIHVYMMYFTVGLHRTLYVTHIHGARPMDALKSRRTGITVFKVVFIYKYG